MSENIGSASAGNAVALAEMDRPIIEYDLLAPGPSMSQALADSVRGGNVGVVGNAFELAPWAEFLAANDVRWWLSYPDASMFQGRKFSGNRRIAGVERLPNSKTSWNSGVLAMAVAVHLGATTIRLHGFDMHGSHFFGPYVNGLRNTDDVLRKIHMDQYAEWARNNQEIRVVNCTPGSVLACFPFDERIARSSGDRLEPNAWSDHEVGRC